MPSILHRLFLQIFFVALMLGLGIWGLDYAHCVAQDVCYVATDFKVVYRPSVALLSGNIHKVYDIAIIERWLESAKDTFFHPTLYPPYSLFLVYPLGWLEPIPSAILWFCGHLLLLVLVMRMRMIRSILMEVSPIYTTMVLLPFCAYIISAGQLGMLSLALFLLVIGWRHSHPVWAGIAFSMLCIKPQMAFALLLLLLREKNRTALVTILLCLAGVMIASFAVWGAALWLDYIKITALSGMILSTAFPVYRAMMASFYIGVRMLGGSEVFGHSAQLCMSGVVAITLWQSLRRCKDDGQRLMLLAPATFLLTPYAFVYDTILLAPVCILLVGRICAGSQAIGLKGLLVLLAFIPVIAVKLQGGIGIPYTIIAILCAYVYAWRQVRIQVIAHSHSGHCAFGELNGWVALGQQPDTTSVACHRRDAWGGRISARIL